MRTSIAILLLSTYQWRIQDFSEGRINSQSVCANLFFGCKLHENERIWIPRGALRSATAYCFENSKEFFVIGSFQISVKVIKYCLILNFQFEPVNKNLQATDLSTTQSESKFSFVKRENKQYYSNQFK